MSIVTLPHKEKEDSYCSNPPIAISAMNMSSYPFSTITRARQHYSDHGFRGLVWNSLLFAADGLIQRRALSRADLQNITAERGVIWYGDQEKPIKISPPDHAGLREAFKPYPKKYEPERSFVCELENCRLLGSNAVGISKDNKLILETVDVVSHSHLGSPARILTRVMGLQTKPAVDRNEERVFPLLSPDPSFYHWMIEYLPKLRLLERYEKQTGDTPTVLVESSPREFIGDTLALTGYELDRCMEWNGPEMRVQYLVIPSHKPYHFDYQEPSLSNYDPSRSDLHWLRNRIRSNADLVKTPGEKRKKIYISRQEASPERGRRVINYRQFIAELHNRGFESYILEELPFQEQVKLFAEADVIMGPHGAGLVNMIFADDPLIIEMFPDDHLKPHFYILADIMGFDYEGIVTEARDKNLIVNTGVLHDRLDRINV